MLRRWPFWLAFATAYLPGLLLLNEVDDALTMILRGHHTDSGVAFLGLYALPIFAIVAAVISKVWKQCDSIGFAVAFSFLAPTAAFLVLISVWLLV